MVVVVVDAIAFPIGSGSAFSVGKKRANLEFYLLDVIQNDILYHA